MSVATPVPVASGRSDRRLIAALAVTQTVGFGALYYAFAVLLVPMATGLGLSTTVVTGGYTAAVLAGAVLAVPVGRWIDRRGAHGLMTAGSVAATALLAAWSTVDSVIGLYAVQIALGLVATMVLYEPAFAVVVSRFEPPRRAGALLVVTVVAGFASSIFLPLTGFLLDRLGWRDTLLVLAVVHGALTVPLHALALRRPRAATGPAASTGPAGGTDPAGGTGAGAGDTVAGGGAVGAGGSRGGRAERRAAARVALRDRRFWLLTAGLTAHGAAVTAFIVHLVAALVAFGHRGTFAASVAGLVGLLSVTGRLVTTAAQRRRPLAGVVAVMFGVQAVAALALPVAGHHVAWAITAVTGFGLGFGVATIAKPALLADRYSLVAYATVSGVVAVPVTVAKATAPLATAALERATGGYGAVFATIGVCCAVAAVAVALAARQR